MTRILALAVSALGFVPFPVFAQSAEDKAAMVNAIAAAGCRVNNGNNAAVLTSAGISEDSAAAVVQSLLDSGEATIIGGDLVLQSGPCS